LPSGPIRWLETFRTPRLRPEFKFRLDDGTPVTVRPLQAGDAQRLRAGFEKLSQLARRRRFLADVDELSEQQLDDFTQLDQVDRAAWGCMNRERPTEPGVGVARYQRVNGDRKSADVAITVLDEYQGRGAGMLLHACLHLTAHRAGIRHFCYDVLRDNERFIAQLKALGGRFEGRAENIERWSLPVYHRARDVPDATSVARRFAEILLKLGRAPAA
jgi:RimJ/RimL family protein N-acetyltransferase